MKALTVRQPWAGLIALGDKDVENRTWLPSLAPGERFAIHAGRDDDNDTHWQLEGIDLNNAIHPLCTVHGLVVCTVRLVGVRRDADSPWALPGQYHWLLDTPRLVRDRTHWRGQRRLWEWQRHHVRDGAGGNGR